MSDNINEFPDLSSLFDQDYSTLDDYYKNHHDNGITSLVDYHEHNFLSDYFHDFYNYNDPLKYVHKFNFQPLQIDFDHTHFVKPHFVEGYIKKDGTFVEGYFRDGDGNTDVNRTLEMGGGYIRTNPDGNPWNNLKWTSSMPL